jgi:hypothetical protein
MNRFTTIMADYLKLTSHGTLTFSINHRAKPCILIEMHPFASRYFYADNN